MPRDARRNEYMNWVAQQSCLVPGCGRPVALHHIQGVRSFKTRQRLRRRQYLADYAVVPLCRKHHQEAPDSVHAIGEEAFGVRYVGGSTAITEWALTFALRFIQEGR